MVNIEQTEHGTLLAGKFLFWYTSPQEGTICLASELGDDMRYKKQATHIVDYPGEYDIDGVGVFCFLGKGNKLSFLIDDQGEKFALIQTPDVLESHTELSSATAWLYTDDAVCNKFEQLELEGEKISLVPSRLG